MYRRRQQQLIQDAIDTMQRTQAPQSTNKQQIPPDEDALSYNSQDHVAKIEKTLAAYKRAISLDPDEDESR